ncbi:MAG: glycosyltransferase 87 family protein [Promethearchaeota archaeon]
MYLIFTILCFIFVPLVIPLENTIIANDYRIFYQSAKIIITDPTQLYTSPVYNMPFRYLPLFSLLFIPYTFLPFEIGFLIHTILMTIVHFASFYLIFITSTKWFNVNFNSRIKRDMLYMSLMAPLQVPLLLIGQITEIFIFLCLMVILLIENEKNRRYKIKYDYFIIGLLIGLSVSYKPFAFLLLPLMLKISLLNNNKKVKIAAKQMVAALLGFMVIFSINIVYWIIYPNLIPDFVDINKSSQLLDYPSTSITRIIFVFFNTFTIQISEFMILIFSTLILYSILLIILFLTPNMVKNYPLFLGLGILITMICFPDSWFLNFLIWFMITLSGLFKFEEELVFMVPDKLKKRLNQTMYLIYKLSQYGILFFTIGIVLDFMILPFDPILPFLLLALYILLIWRLILFLKIRNQFEMVIINKNKK